MKPDVHEITISRPGRIEDAKVILQIPDRLMKKLGELQEKSYDPKFSCRTLQFEHGKIEYYPYRYICKVTIE